MLYAVAGDSENLRTIVVIEEEFATEIEEMNHSFDTLVQNRHQPKVVTCCQTY